MAHLSGTTYRALTGIVAIFLRQVDVERVDFFDLQITEQ
jgi:hypothetical protein